MFKLTARTILELGSELISSDAIAFYELIKNGIDAGSTSGVTIKFDIVLGRRDVKESKSRILKAIDAPKKGSFSELDSIKQQILNKLNSEAEELWGVANELIKSADSLESLQGALTQIDDLNSITISDTGSGMSLDDLNSVFLVIGTASRKKEVDIAMENGESHVPFLGEKGIGRLSAMRLGNHLSVQTSRTRDEHYNHIDIDWTEFDDATKMVEDICIQPRVGKKKGTPDFSGTAIRINKLNADWTEKRVNRLAMDDFSLIVNPLGKGSKQRIAIFWNDKRINFQRLEKSFLSHAHAKIQGKYRIAATGPELELRFELNNLGFEHPNEVIIEVIPADVLHASLVGPQVNRRRMHKRDVDYPSLATVGPFDFELYWYNRATLRKGNSQDEARRLTNILEQWVGVRLYRDGFRVYPYGEEDDDWLELDKNALRSSGYALNRIQMVGQVEVGRLKNPYLVDQTNREGLRQTPEEAVLREAVQFSVTRLRGEMIRYAKNHKVAQKQLIEDETKTIDLESRMKAAIKSISNVVPFEHQQAVRELELMREEFARYAVKTRERIADMEKDAGQMVSMAGIGLMVEVIAHELTRSAEDALDVLNGLKRRKVPEEVKRKLESLRASMTSITKRLRILDPLSVTGRQRKERFNINEFLRDTLDAHETQFARHQVSLNVSLPENPVRVHAVKGMVAQVLENLISNSIYWMSIEKEASDWFKPELTIVLEENPPRIRFSDNGPGIPEQYKDRVFELFFSLKDKSRRRGLGLFIAREAAEKSGGELILDPDTVNEKGRCSTFDFRIMGGEA